MKAGPLVPKRGPERSRTFGLGWAGSGVGVDRTHHPSTGTPIEATGSPRGPGDNVPPGRPHPGDVRSARDHEETVSNRPAIDADIDPSDRAWRGCGHVGLARVLDPGRQPEAGRFPRLDDPRPEDDWPLVVDRCAACGLVQLD